MTEVEAEVVHIRRIEVGPNKSLYLYLSREDGEIAISAELDPNNFDAWWLSAKSARAMGNALTDLAEMLEDLCPEEEQSE